MSSVLMMGLVWSIAEYHVSTIVKETINLWG